MVKQNTSDSSIARHTCTDIDECASFNSHCPHECINIKGSHVCECASGFLDPHGDGSLCESSSESVILVAHGSEIRQLRPNFTDYLYSPLIDDTDSILAMDIDPVDRIVYYIDEYSELIRRAFIPVTKTALGHSQTLTALKKSEFTALTVDWLAKNLYFAVNHTIQVSTIDGRYSKTLITQRTQRIHSMVVDPILGVLYWINSGSGPGIIKASMNGADLKALVEENLSNPTGLTIDYFMSHRVFWCDSKFNFIESVLPDGTDRVRVFHNSLRSPFKMDVFDSHLFWLDSDAGAIHKVDKFGRGSNSKLVEGLDLVEDLKIYNQLKVLPKCNFFKI